ncbi:anhydro-N-acetylmuramic acid kinase [Candidatus Methylopumilus planktonicus]|uniref:anhydro-N-acetylmuramic acid kinase n=1 Tax=Candidatus Methylopumilus planktonicus TaxID=1581557 RepID=UPI003BEF4885
MNELFIGLMSGTSLDGMDAVLVSFGDSPQDIKMIGHSYVAYEDTLKKSLLELHLPYTNELEDSLIAGNIVSQKAYQAIEALLKKTGTSSKDIKAIGFHGQTIRHQPQKGFTLQIGNPALLAEICHINVIADFRTRDIAAGGQGAPLVPAFHKEIFSHPTIHRAIVNIGGIANITILNPKTSTSGFDSGPGNILLDHWSQTHLHKAFDEDGSWAREGQLIQTLLDAFFNDTYFEKTAPKSTGRDHFNEAWLNKHLQKSYSIQDIQRTLLELTALSISNAIKTHNANISEIYLCGGGALNSFLVERLKSLIPQVKIQLTDALGLSTQHVEAAAFAWLAKQTLFSKPGNLPQVTGAKGLRILGALYPT